MRQGPPQRRLSPRQRVFILLMGLVIIGVLGRLAYQLNATAPYVFQPVIRSVGEVVASAPGNEGPDSRIITVNVLDGDQQFAGTFPVPGPFGAQLAVGDRVAVLYRLSETRQSMELVECGLVALPERNQ